MKNKKVISAIIAMALSAAMITAFAADTITNTDVDNSNVAVQTDDGTVLTEGIDYTLEYRDNVNVGTANVIVHFIGNYIGEKSHTFEIKKKTSTGSGSGGGSRIQPTVTPSPTPTTAPPSPKPTAEPKIYEHNAYIKGYEDGTFRPDATITRAETASMLYVVLEKSNTTAGLTFSDLENEAWYIPAIKAMTETGIIKGYEDGTFRPNTDITRAEFTAMIMRTETVQKFAELPFSDVSADLWSADYIYSAYKAGYIKGYEDGTFKPDNPITRAEAVKIINSVLDRTDFSNETNPFSDVSSEHWAYKQILEAAVTHRVQ